MPTKPPPALPDIDPAYEALTLEELRELRRELGEEEQRVSYWRRIIQARLDLLDHGRSQGDIVERLTSVLAETGSIHRRLVNLSVKPADDIPALPDLRKLWTRMVDLDDQDKVDAFVADLRGVEAELSALRREIHERLDEATGQLIARYRQEPTLALSALPDIELR